MYIFKYIRKHTYIYVYVYIYIYRNQICVVMQMSAALPHSEMGSQKILTLPANKNFYNTEQLFRLYARAINRFNWTDDTNIKSSKIADICDSTESRVAHR